MENSNIWKIINKYFEDNPQALVRHHVESYNDFFKNGIFQIFKEKNPITISTRFDEEIDDHRSKCVMYFGGKNNDKIYFGKPIIYDEKNTHFMYPNEARLRDMTYGMTIHYDVDIEFIDILEEGETPTLIGAEDLDIVDEEKEGGANKAPKRKGKSKKTDLEMTPAELTEIKEITKKSMINQNTQKRTITLEKILLGRFPIMLQSNFCVLYGLPTDIRHSMGECLNDVGGYFIIDGKEKTVVSQEKFGDNMLYVRKLNEDDKYSFSAEIRSVSENVSKPQRTLSVKVVKKTNKFTFENIVVNIPNVRAPVPLFIVFRAMGFISDKQIISMCLLDLEKYENMIDLFIPSVHDAGAILTQRDALKFISLLTKGKTVPHALEILCDYFLPHIGENNFTNKAYYLGFIVFKLLSVYNGNEEPTDRDNNKYKRLEMVGNLMYDLFREYYSIQLRTIHVEFEKRAHYNQSLYANNLFALINENYSQIFRDKIVEKGFKKAFKGDWGSQVYTKRIGVVQDLNRLSHNSMMSHLRKTNLPLDATAKVVGPRVLHSTQWGLFDPIDTPDGGNIGLHKHLSIGAYITQGYSRKIIIDWLRKKVDMKLIENYNPISLSTMTKVFVNGSWCGAITEPFEVVDKFLLFRRNGLIPIYTSISFDKMKNIVNIFTDSGRLCRPIFYFDKETNKMSFDKSNILEYIESDKFHWNDLITGFNEKKIEYFNPNANNMYNLHELYDNVNDEENPAKLSKFLQNKAIIDFIDTNETESSLIALNKEAMEKRKLNYTHMEIHESLIFGTMCNLINFLENNPATRNSFSCGQSKQACSMYHTNFQNRMDKTAVLLNSGQNPLVKTRYLEYINNESNPYGENTIVAIMCYTGYNVEDAILINEGALKRGLFRTTYFTTYQSHEEKSKTNDSTNYHVLLNVENDSTIIGKKPGYDYSLLDKHGVIKENTEINDKTILLGMASYDSENVDIKTDLSKTSKKGQLGIVDKTYITEGDEGERIAKVRIREERIPNIGDKMASRAGQKGTVGLVIPECDMPFSKSGIKPDIIINPHAIPSRMTIGQLVETITGKACAMFGTFGDCTAYNNNGSKIRIYGELLNQVGYHSSGNEILYDGMNGKQIDSEIFIGPNYYMRLKHMVKDKINYRSLGPRTFLTKQAVSGRANDGGLRIGEMERDGVISHGASEFLRESMMERGDKYKMAVCNNTGMLAIYNSTKDLFLSPMADGPMKYEGSLDNNSMNINTVSKFGRNFSIVNVPYSLKLLIQELLSINIGIRIITEENVDQFDNMTFSNNIDLLLKQENAQVKDIVTQIKKNIYSSKNMEEQLNQIKTPAPSLENTMDNMIPDSNYDNSPPYNPYSSSSAQSSVYNPISPETPPIPPPGTQDFVTGTPSFSPNTPPFPPGTTELPASTPKYYPIDSFSSDDSYIPPPPTAPYPETEQEQVDSNLTKNNDNFEVGQIVHWRGDFITDRLWQIIKVTPNFLTIKTDNSEGLDNLETIKVVPFIDVYKEGDYPYSSPYVNSNPNTLNTNNVQTNQNSKDAPGIYFAPVISIKTGSEQKEGAETSVPEKESEQISQKQNEKEPQQKGGLSDFFGGLVIKKP